MASKELKVAFVKRCNALGISIKDVCFFCDLEYKVIRNRYINRSNNRSSVELGEADIRKLLSFVGMEIQVMCTMKKIDSVRQSIKDISQEKKLSARLHYGKDKKPTREG